MRIVVAGTGYVGLVTAVCFAEHGYDVTCVDVNQAKIDMLKKGISPIYEEGLQELMQKNSSRLCYTTDANNAYANADVIFVGVGTPEKKDGSANLSYVFDVCQQIKASIKNDVVVVIKSTVPIGTNDRIEKLLNTNGRYEVSVVSNPEFLAQGTAVKDTLHPSRIVIGANNQKAMDIIARLYSKYNAPIIKTNRCSAEMIKYASNDFLALKISYINEIANLCELVGADIESVTEGMGFDERIGKHFLKAGIGYGGSCFPKDTKALHWLANYHDFELKTIKAAIEVNENQKLKLIKKAAKIFSDGFSGLNIAVLGLTFKPKTDDLRESPSLVVVPTLVEEGANVKVFDPIGSDNFKKVYNESKIEYCDTAINALKNADLCLILTEWDEIKQLKPCDFVNHMKSAIVLDGRNCYDVKAMRDAKIDYYSIGR